MGMDGGTTPLWVTIAGIVLFFLAVFYKHLSEKDD